MSIYLKIFIKDYVTLNGWFSTLFKFWFIEELVCIEMRGVGDVAPYKQTVFVPVVSTEGGARAAGATLKLVVFHFKSRVWGDIDVIPSPSF